MPHVSSKKLADLVSKKLWRQLLQTFKDAGQFSATDIILKELLTNTEKTMLAKRLAIIILLDKGLPQHVVANELNVSPSTVARMSLNIDKGMYDAVLRIAGKKNILEALEKFILMGMPPRTGRVVGIIGADLRQLNKYTFIVTTIYRSVNIKKQQVLASSLTSSATHIGRLTLSSTTSVLPESISDFFVTLPPRFISSESKLYDLKVNYTKLKSRVFLSGSESTSFTLTLSPSEYFLPVLLPTIA